MSTPIEPEFQEITISFKAYPRLTEISTRALIERFQYLIKFDPDLSRYIQTKPVFNISEPKEPQP